MNHPIELAGAEVAFFGSIAWTNESQEIGFNETIHVCSWCEGQERKTTKALNKAGYHNISHGMCKKCFDNILNHDTNNH